MNRGKAWEAQLIAWHHAYAKAGLAFVVQAPPAVKVIGKPDRGRFLACWSKSGPPDFAGGALGRPVVFDAKHSDAARWPLKNLEPHQARDLNTATKAGALAFVALRLPDGAFVLPWETLGPVWMRWGRGEAERGDSSIDATRAAELGLPMNEDGWLDAVRELLARGAA